MHAHEDENTAASGASVMPDISQQTERPKDGHTAQEGEFAYGTESRPGSPINDEHQEPVEPPLEERPDSTRQSGARHSKAHQMTCSTVDGSDLGVRSGERARWSEHPRSLPRTGESNHHEPKSRQSHATHQSTGKIGRQRGGRGGEEVDARDGTVPHRRRRRSKRPSRSATAGPFSVSMVWKKLFEIDGVRGVLESERESRG